MARRRAPRIVPTLVMSASFASAIPTCTLLSTQQGCGGPDIPDVCKGSCGDVAAEAFTPDRISGGDVAAAFDAGAQDSAFDTMVDDAPDDAPDGGD